MFNPLTRDFVALLHKTLTQNTLVCDEDALAAAIDHVASLTTPAEILTQGWVALGHVLPKETALGTCLAVLETLDISLERNTVSKIARSDLEYPFGQSAWTTHVTTIVTQAMT